MSKTQFPTEVPQAGEPQVQRKRQVEPPQHDFFTSRTCRNLSILVTIVGVLVTFAFWGVLRAAERAHVNRMTSLAARSIAENLAGDIPDRRNALQRMSKVRAFEHPATQSEWNSYATTFLMDYPGYLAVEFADSSYRVQDVVTLDNVRADMGLDLKLNPSLHQALAAARNRRELTLTPLELLPNGRKVQRILVPVFKGDEFRGFLLAKVDVAASLEEMLKDVPVLGYAIEVVQDGQVVYVQPGADRKLAAKWGQTAEWQSLGNNWTIRAWPNPQLLSQLRTRLPEFALLLPVGLTGLILIMLKFLKDTSRHAREMGATNAQLNTALHMRKLAEDELRESRARLAGVLETSADAIISTNKDQRITLFNHAAEAIFGYKSEEVIGQSLDMLLQSRIQAAHRGHVERFSKSSDRLRKVMAARAVMGLRKDGTEFPLDASVSKLEIKGEEIYTAILRDVTERQRAEEELRRAHDELEVRVEDRTAELHRSNQALQAEIAERKEAEEMLRQLSGRLLQAQDEERRRVARELHDSTAQYLCALSLNIAEVQRSQPELPKPLLHILSDTSLLVDRCSTEIRSLSYLLHPPLLDDLGLTSALHWYAGGFKKRSGVDVELELYHDRERLPRDHESAYFRIVQECLTNVRKHSGATAAKIRLSRDEQGTHLEVSDNGCGMPGVTQTTSDVAASLGVGIAGMRERVRQLGGHLEIRSSSEGSVVSAGLPLPRESSNPALCA